MPADAAPSVDPVATLDRVVAARPEGVAREGQRQMAAAVAGALEKRHHLLVEAGTGTGKSLAYLVPALAEGGKVVVATATKALQDQLAHGELPLLREVLGSEVTWAVLKGRQSYVCMAKLVERFGPDLEGSLLGDDDELLPLARWAAGHPTGDRDDLDEAVPDGLWREVSVSGMECPGKARCPQGERCLAEAAFGRAENARIVITNQHLYGLHLASGERILPPHDAVVIDEAHKLEGALSSAFGVDVTPGRFTHFAGQVRRLVPDRPGRDGVNPIADLRDVAEELRRVLEGRTGRIDPAEGELGAVLLRATTVVTAAMRRVRGAGDAGDPSGLAGRVLQQGGHLAGDVGYVLDLPDGAVAWVEGGAVRVAPVDVGGSLAAALLVRRPAVLTSATLTVGGSFRPLAARLGFVEEPLDDDPLAEDVEDPVSRTYRGLVVGGAFDYPAQGLIYIASHLPDPRSDEFAAAAIHEIERLLAASEGRALVLTTSHRMVAAVAETLAGGPHRVLAQGDLPKRRLVATFAGDEHSVLVATMGFWEGIDVPGPSLSLVIIDKLPFPRPDDPLVTARREAVERRGGSAFGEVDLPTATILLAQGAGRLIRTETDRGVVAILDPRLTKMRYGRRIIRSLPPMRRTSDHEVAIRHLRTLADGSSAARG